MAEQSDYESWVKRRDEVKRALRRLRSSQRKLNRQFVSDLPRLHTDRRLWDSLAAKSGELLMEESHVQPDSIDTDRYPIAWFNLFSALGFQFSAGPIPRLSGVQPGYRKPLFAYSATRAVLIESYPETLFADLADIQAICPVPILGLVYNSQLSVVGLSPFWAAHQMERRRVARALALGHVVLSFEDLRLAVASNPESDKAALLELTKQTGLMSFLNPPVDALPVFGEHLSRNHNWGFTIEDFVRDVRQTSASGAEMSPGDVTMADPSEVLKDTDYYFRELQRAKLIGVRKEGLRGTQEGWSYLRSRVLPFPLGQLLHHACMAAREEVAEAAKSAFVEALRRGQPNIEFSSNSAFLPIDEIDSFAGIAAVAPRSVASQVPVAQSECEIKQLICSILGITPQADWGGEQNDIFTTHLFHGGKREIAAFLLKGPSSRGRLTIAKCGKNGDQLQRLFQSAADVFIIQSNHDIDERVVAEARQKVAWLRSRGNSHAVFSLLDGLDTARLIAAYGERLRLSSDGGQTGNSR